MTNIRGIIFTKNSLFLSFTSVRSTPSPLLHFRPQKNDIKINLRRKINQLTNLTTTTTTITQQHVYVFYHVNLTKNKISKNY